MHANWRTDRLTQ